MLAKWRLLYVAVGSRDAAEDEHREGVEVCENLICNWREVGSAFKG
jgi:hypothetical protein